MPDREPAADEQALDDALSRLSCYTTTPERSLEVFKAARAKCPVAHSDQHDGFHLLLDHDDVKSALRDHENLSSEPSVMRPLLPRKPLPVVEMDPWYLTAKQPHLAA
jgi:cytochrome P450